MEAVFEVLKRVVFAVMLITITNMCLNNIIAYSLFNIGFVSLFSIPGMIVLVFMVYFIK